jgi:hypothetical protein
MTDSITPPSDQLKKWEDKWFDEEEHPDVLLIQAFQAGADQELEACCEWIKSELRGQLRPAHRIAIELRDARRPKPPSLKEQALEVFEALIHGDASGLDVGVIRRALEALPA